MLCVLLLLVTAGLLPPRAAARTRKDEARASFFEGVKLYQAKQYEEAVKKFRSSYRLYPSPTTIYNLAISYRDMGKDSLAAQEFESFLADPDKKGVARIRSARADLAKLGEKLASLMISCAEGGATLFIDGDRVGTLPLKRNIFVAPGARRIEVRKAGFRPVTRQMILERGLHRSQAVELVAVAVRKRPRRRRKVDRPRESQASAARARRRRTRTILAYSTLGVASAAAVTAAVLVGVGASRGSAAHDDYHRSADSIPPASGPEIESHRFDIIKARRLLVAGGVISGVCAAALGASIYFFLTRPAEKKPGAELSVSASVGGGSLSLVGTF